MTRSFTDRHRVAAFPLGGIGTGNVSLGARGDLRDWELGDRPAKGNRSPNTFFCIRVQVGDGPPIAKVLEGPIPPPHDLSHGYHPNTAGGLPRFAQSAFEGEYPIATVELEHPDVPLDVRLEAFTPLVPLDPDDSGIPGAVLTWSLRNRADGPVSVTLVGSLINPIGGLAYDGFGNLAAGGLGGNRTTVRDEGGLRGVFLSSDSIDPIDLRAGDLTLATTHPDVTIAPAWLRGAWYDFLQAFWDDLVTDGLLEDRGYPMPSEPGTTDTASVGALAALAPGASVDIRFLLTWSFPNRTNAWWPDPAKGRIRNHYATRFATSWDAARHLVAEMPRLEATTRRFRDLLFDSTLPEEVLDAVSANIVPVRSQTCFRLADGRFHGFEGCFDDAGSCEGTCTHVWSYAYTVSALFPSLEREARRIELTLETDDTGYMSFRTHRPFGSEFVWPWGDQRPEAAIDGQMGTVLRTWREWRLSGDRAWLEPLWPGVQRAMRYAAEHWDTDGDGVPDGRQHNTYDIELHGPNPLSAIYYLAGLRALEELARVMGDETVAADARARFERAGPRTDELLWDGEDYVQRIEDVDAHRYQHGLGCLADQLLGQLHARLLGLGDLLPPDHVRSAIGAVFRHDFRRDFRDHVNAQRTYVLNDEAGLVLCSWPKGGRPRLPFVYSDEVWTGIEYQVASHLVLEGLVDEGLDVVRAVHARHDGIRRNPWDEVECGHHYVRSMSSWALLLAFSGATADVATGTLGFAPRWSEDDFRCLFAAGTAWGTYRQRRTEGRLEVRIRVAGGSFDLRRLTVDGEVVLDLEEPCQLSPEQPLHVWIDRADGAPG
ncbi:MAG: GH116 family glycosyl-hydrolase [Candidatus Limnocylindrales bacterium]